MEDVLFLGDPYSVLTQLEKNSINITITSVPSWEQKKGKSGGRRTKIGHERSAEEYIGHLITIFNLLKQKMTKYGVLFVNVQDRYLNRYGYPHLLQIPYRFAYHMLKSGWRLEDILIWHKSNPGPSLARSKFSNVYEPILVFSRSRRCIYEGQNNKIIKAATSKTNLDRERMSVKVIQSLINRVAYEDGDVIFDPFAGVGNLSSAIRKIRKQLFAKKIYSMQAIEDKNLASVIKKRSKISKVLDTEKADYSWRAVKEKQLATKGKRIEIIINEKYGEALIVEESRRFQEILRGMVVSEGFKLAHRADAVYFFGVKDWNIEDLYYPFTMLNFGYVLRNMLVVSASKKWYPVFMFVNDNKKMRYKFYLDRIRTEKKIKPRAWRNKNFVGLKVKDNTGREQKEGIITEIMKFYDDQFPKFVKVKWDNHSTVELVLHPNLLESVMEGLSFICPKCGKELIEGYNPVGKNVCINCNTELWNSSENLPIIKEPKIIIEATDELKNIISSAKAALKTIKEPESINSTKEYFSKLRMYRLDQASIAQYLTVLINEHKLRIATIRKYFPSEYTHTVAHWFRKDFSGSIPLPEDAKKLKEVTTIEHSIFTVLQRTILKYQSTLATTKGKNPGDLIVSKSEKQLMEYLRKTYLPPLEYLKQVNKNKGKRSIQN